MKRIRMDRELAKMMIAGWPFLPQPPA